MCLGNSLCKKKANIANQDRTEQKTFWSNEYQNWSNQEFKSY